MTTTKARFLISTACACAASLAAAENPEKNAGESGPLIQERIIPAPVDQVWAAFTTADGLEAWMVPHAEIDLKVGGKMRTNYHADGSLGDPNTIENTILSLHPGQMLSIKATKAPAGFRWTNALKDMWSVIYFEPLGPARTRVTSCGFGYTDTEESKQMREHFVKGNAWTLDRLEEHFSKKRPGTGQSTDADAANTKKPAGPDGDALTLLAKCVGGEWIHESTTNDGQVFRVRNVVKFAPDGESLVADAGLGGADGLFHHGSTQIWREPGTGQVRFQNIDEAGAVSRGHIDLAGENTTVWDWNIHRQNGATARFAIELSFPDNDHYRMVMHAHRPDGTIAQLLNAVYERVEKAPPRSRRLRSAGESHGEGPAAARK